MPKVNVKSKKKKTNDVWDIRDIGAVILRSLKLLFNVLFVLVFFGFVFGSGIAVGYVGSLFEKVEVPDRETLISKVSHISGVSQLNYADGSMIAEVKSDLLRETVSDDLISPYIKNAVKATEDENFEDHKGVVPKAVFRAALGIVGLGSSSGGSTLTQQLIKQQVVGDAATFSRKVSEIIYALELERNLSKEEILTLYLNVSSFGRNNQGQNIAGVEEAARGIFGVTAAELTVPQAAFIAGLPQSPINYSPYTSGGQIKPADKLTAGLKRAKDVLYNMYRTGYLSKEEYEAYEAYDITQDFLPGAPITEDTKDYLYYAVVEEAEEALYQYLIDRDQVPERDLRNDETVKAYKKLAAQELSQGNYTVSTTINRPVYEAMQAVAANHSGVLQDGTSPVESGNVLLDNDTGAVIGFVGGLNYANNQVNHAFDTKRSPGSNIKPVLVYAPAIDQGLMGSASILSNYPTTYSGGQQIMHGNSSGTGMETLQNALNQSQNIPAYWTYKALQDSGADVSVYMEKMGISIAEYGIESLPLGSGIELSVAQMANAYQTLANNGVYQKYYMVDKITSKSGEVVYQHQDQPVQVYSKPAATIMQELLRGPIDSSATTSFQGALGGLNGSMVNLDWIGKTGSTDYYTDVWLSLATPRSTLSGWAGHDDNTGMPNDAGNSRNSQYMAQMAAAIHAADPAILGDPSETFKLDDKVIKSTVLKATGQRPGNVTVDGKNVTVDGETVESHWAVNGAPETSYKFMIGGTDSDYAKAWSSISGIVKQEEKKQEDKPADEDRKEEQRTNESSESSSSSEADSP